MNHSVETVSDYRDGIFHLGSYTNLKIVFIYQFSNHPRKKTNEKTFFFVRNEVVIVFP